MNISSGTSNDPLKYKTFVTEAEIEEHKLKRQEEWEKVRKPDDPLEAPEEEYDPRSLFERLQEQKDKRDAEYEESHKLKNLIKGLDDDEVAFLELVDKTKIEMEAKLFKEEMKEIEEYRKAVAHLSEAETKLQELRKNSSQQMANSSKKTQQSLLAGALKRKLINTSSPEKKKSCLHLESEHKGETSEKKSKIELSHKSEESNSKEICVTVPIIGGLQCLGVLPGLGAYSDSSDSENSSNSDTEKDNQLDLIGRRRILISHAQPPS